MIKLNAKQRLDLIVYSRNYLESTILVRNEIENFFSRVTVTKEEEEKYLTINEGSVELSQAGESYITEFPSITPGILQAIQKFINTYDNEETKDSESIRKALEVFKLVV